MSRSLTLLAAAAMLALAVPSRARAQSAADGLRITVQPSVELLGGGLVRVSYVLRSAPESRDSLSIFAVDAPAPPTVVQLPGPASRWLAFSSYGPRPVAAWSMLGPLLAAGQTSPALTFEAVGLPDVVRYVAMRYAPVRPGALEDSGPDDAGAPAGSDLFEPDTDVVLGSTIGVAGLPGDTSTGALAARLAALVDRACALAWVDNQGVCTSLRAKAVPSAGPLGALLEELDAQRGHHVTEAGYALLRANAVYLLGRL